MYIFVVKSMTLLVFVVLTLLKTFGKLLLTFLACTFVHYVHFLRVRFISTEVEMAEKQKYL